MRQILARPGITPRNVGGTVWILLLMIILAGLAIQPVSADSYSDAKVGSIPPSAPQKTNAEIMKEFGVQVLANAPANIKSSTNAEKAKYAFTQYCNRLAAANTPVNSDLSGRALQLFTHGDSGRWTCSDHTQNVQGLFEGMGISGKDMVMLEADSNSYLPTPNSNHGALVVRDNNGKSYVFDAWAMAVNNLDDIDNPGGANTGTTLYGGADTSEWNGMDVERWGNNMQKAGYSRFTADGGGSWGTSYVVTNDWFNNLAVTYPSSFTFVLFPKGGGNAVQLLYNYPITVDDKGTVGAVYHTEGPTPYTSDYNEKTTFADLSVTGKYDKKTGKMSGEFTSRMTKVSSSRTVDFTAQGTFTGQIVKDGKTMTTFLEGTSSYFSLDSAAGAIRQGPYDDKGWFPWTAAAVVSQQTY
jgi:hypothetical protein